VLLHCYPDPFKITFPADKASPRSSGSAGEGAGAAETTTESSKQPRRRNRRNRQRRNRNRQKKPAISQEGGISTSPTAHVSDIRVADMEKDNNNGNMMAESEFKKEEAPAITVTAKVVTTTASMDEAKRAREWFATLSAEDQVEALGFVDQDFLAILISRAAKSSSSLSSPSACGGYLVTDRRGSEGQY
jgi:hypothetical protein